MIKRLSAIFLSEAADVQGAFLALYNPALFGPFITLSPELLEGVTCSKKGLKLCSPNIRPSLTQFRYLSHLVREI